MTPSEKEYWSRYYSIHSDEIKARAKKWAQDHKKHRKEYLRKYYLRNREVILNRTREHRIKNPRSKKNARILKQYGITLEQYEAMRSMQGGKCKLCGRKSTLVLDHCHKTGRLRGFLCEACNVTIAALGDDVVGVMRAVEYLG